jgi:hypothetical protein
LALGVDEHRVALVAGIFLPGMPSGTNGSLSGSIVRYVTSPEIVARSYTPIDESLRSRPTPQCRFSCNFMIAMRLISSTGGSVITAQAMYGR